MNTYNKFVFRTLSIWFICILQASVTVNAVDTPSWNEAVQLFTNSSASLNISYVGQKLKEADEKKAAALLIPLTSTNQPIELRKRAITAIGGGAIKAAIPELVEIALNTNEVFDVRYAALNPGLQHMRDDRAVKTAKQLLHDPNRHIRIASYWVLSGNPSPESVKLLRESLRNCEPDIKSLLIWALCHTGRPEAARIVFEDCPLDWITNNDVARAYCGIMTQYSFCDAQETILKIMARKDGNARWEGLHYFALFPRKEVSEYILPFFENKKWPFAESLESYPMLFAFATSQEITSEVRQKLQVLVLKFNPYAQFDIQQAFVPAAKIDRNAEKVDILKALFRFQSEDIAKKSQWRPQAYYLLMDGKDPSPDVLKYFEGSTPPIRPASEYNGQGTFDAVGQFQWITNDQVLLRVGHSGAESMFLAVQKDNRWIVTSGHLLWVE